MITCDLCRKQLPPGVKHVESPKNNKRICATCVEWCTKIMKDESITSKIIYLNQYKEETERRKNDI